MKQGDPVLQHLSEAFDAVVEGPPRPRALRCSALPYCPLLDTLDAGEPERGDLSGALYMSIGTAMHAALQFYMVLGKRGAGVWGNWECTQCGKKWENRFRPRDCCDVPVAYREAMMRVACMTGHSDLVVKYANGKWVLLDFKTTGRNPGHPKRQHLLQVRHYVALLLLQHKIRIDGYYIVYVGRGKPAAERWVYGPYDAHGSLRETKDWVFRAIRGFKAATQARRDPTRANLAAVVRERPCKSRADFDAYMSRSYNLRGGCPLLPHCTAGDRQSLRALEDSLAGDTR